MTRVTEIAEHWSGLCRKPPVFPASRVLMSSRPCPAGEGSPGGGAGRPGTIWRGIGAALSGTKTLAQNRQLLWFTFLAGLVLAGNATGQGALGYITWTLQPGETEWVVLNFIIEFATLFCLVYLLTGLVLSLPPEKAGHASFLKGLGMAGKYHKAILAWSLVLALAGMLLFSMYFYAPDWLPRNDEVLAILGILYGPVNLLVEFPFNPTLAGIFSDPSRIEGLSPVSWIYPSGIVQALTFSGINLLLFILTPFVVPLIVLEKKTLRDAMAGSFNLMKRNRDEAGACAAFLGVVASGVFLTYLLVQAASGMAAPDDGAVVRPENAWIALALVYDAALFCFALIMATVAGIAARDLCVSVTGGQIAAESTGPAGEAA